jgi:hypothetical protein
MKKIPKATLKGEMKFMEKCFRRKCKILKYQPVPEIEPQKMIEKQLMDFISFGTITNLENI